MFLNYLCLHGLSYSAWIGDVELAEGLAPAHHALALDDAGGLVGRLPVCWRRASRSLALLSSMLMMASHSSLTTASSPGSGRGPW
jgi:hypothetical protein